MCPTGTSRTALSPRPSPEATSTPAAPLRPPLTRPAPTNPNSWVILNLEIHNFWRFLLHGRPPTTVLTSLESAPPRFYYEGGGAMALLNRKVDYALLILSYLHHHPEGS